MKKKSGKKNILHHLEHEGEKDVVLALPLPQGDEVVGERRVRINSENLDVPLIKAVVYQFNLKIGTFLGTYFRGRHMYVEELTDFQNIDIREKL